MINQPTIDKLHAMRLGAMADAFNSQDGDHSYEALSFNDRFGMLVDSEYQKRRTSKLQKSIKTATFRYPDACVENIEYHADRHWTNPRFFSFQPAAIFVTATISC